MKKTSSGGGGSGGTSGDKKRGRRSYGDSAIDTPPRVSDFLLIKFTRTLVYIYICENSYILMRLCGYNFLWFYLLMLLRSWKILAPLIKPKDNPFLEFVEFWCLYYLNWPASLELSRFIKKTWYRFSENPRNNYRHGFDHQYLDFVSLIWKS